jgi:uncharacterized membrane protein YccC
LGAGVGATLPELSDWIFSAKAFAAAMLAFYIALAADLDHPYWCIATVYVVAQPLAGAMRAKGIYRLCGTVVGAVAAIILVPNLVDAPVLLVGALCLWLGLCLYLALCDRTPRAYLYMLAGYTAAVIGFPAVDQPDLIFVVAWARVEEIGLGIICATLVGAIFFPRPTAPVLDAYMARYFRAARHWATSVLTGATEDDEVRKARRTMAGVPGEFDTLIASLPHDISPQHAVLIPVEVLRARLTYLMPVIAQVSLLVTALERVGGMTQPVRDLLLRVAAFLNAGLGAAHEPVSALRAALGTEEVGPKNWAGLIKQGLAARLTDFVCVVQDIRVLRRRVLSGDPHLPALELPPGIGPDASRYRDHAMALLSSVTAMLAVMLVCAFWILSEWPEGGIAAMMTAILCAFFATLDNPVPQMMTFLVDIAVGFFISAFYLFAVLPQIVDFAGLALVLAPFYVVLAAFPRTRSTALNTTMMMTLTAHYNADFAAFINTSLASAAGITSAAIVTALVRSVGADVTARRLRHACRHAVAEATRHPAARPAFAARFLDCIVELAPRIDGMGADTRLGAALRDLNVGLSIIEIQHPSTGQSQAINAEMAAALAMLGAHYQEPGSHLPAAELRAALDDALGGLFRHPSSPHLAVELLSLRLNLFPDAPLPDPAPDDTRSCA